MKTILSNKLTPGPTTLEASGSLPFGERTMPIDAVNVIELTEEHTQQIADDILLGLRAFGGIESTLAAQKIGLPTALARVDCTINPITGSIHTYEVEERPAGMGVSNQLTQEVTGRQLGSLMLDHLEHTFGELPVVKRHPNALPNDDDLLLRVEPMSQNRLASRGRPLLVRAEPRDIATHPMLEEATALSVTPLVEKGKRLYRVATGMAQLVTHTATLPKNSVVVKTLQGSKAKGVGIHLTKEDSRSLGSNRDALTRSQIEAMVSREGAVIVEPFVPGIPVEVNGTMGRMILRVFGLVSKSSVNVIGGSFMARPGHLVHGSKDAICGVVITGQDTAVL